MPDGNGGPAKMGHANPPGTVMYLSQAALASDGHQNPFPKAAIKHKRFVSWVSQNDRDEDRVWES